MIHLEIHFRWKVKSFETTFHPSQLFWILEQSWKCLIVRRDVRPEKIFNLEHLCKKCSCDPGENMTSFEPQQVSRQVAWPRVTKNRLDKPLYLRYTDKCGPGKIFIISSSLDRENIQKKMFQLKSGKSCSSILIGCTHHCKVRERSWYKVKTHLSHKKVA